MNSVSRDVMELRWENGQLGLHALELNNPTKSWTGVGEGGPADHTLESIVHQATTTKSKWDEEEKRRWRAEVQMQPSGGKRPLPVPEESACASASAAFCRDPDATMITWNSFDSPRSLKTPRIHQDDDSLYQDFSENQDGGTKGESCRSQSSARRSRAAAIHNLSERRRRDRINEKMKALQKLVPNASKTDKASMLDEVIEYLKQLQAQVHMMSNNARNMPQMMMQQQLQMSLLARMGMGMGMNVGMMGMGMLDVNNLTRNPFMPPQFPLKPNVDVSSSMPNFNHAYNTFLAQQQSMNMEMLNKMYRQQQSSQQPSKKPALSLPNDAQGQGG